MPFEYFLPTRIVFGSGSIQTLPVHITKLFPTARSIFLITGSRSLRRSELYDKMLKILEKYNVFLFDNVESGPGSKTLEAAIVEFKKSGADIILAIGGGSVLDLGKAVAILSRNAGTLSDYQSGSHPLHEAIPYIAVPTTIGTASEMTVWSVITNTEGPHAGKRKSFSNEKMYPKLAIIDPDFSLSLPFKQTMETALDIFSASIESYWSKQSNPISSIFALSAIEAAQNAIPRLAKEPENPKFREELALACLYSGLAVSNSRTGMPHKVSYPLSTRYKLQHGAACMLTLPYFFEFFGESKPESVAKILKILGAENAQEGAEALKKITKSVGLPSKLSEIGVTKESISSLVDDAYVPKEEQNDPVPLSREDLQKILQNAL